MSLTATGGAGGAKGSIAVASEKPLSLDDFGAKFDLRALVNRITRQAARALDDAVVTVTSTDPTSGGAGGDSEGDGVEEDARDATILKVFSPQPFIAAFECALEDITTLRRANATTISSIARDAKHAEATHTKALGALTGNLDTLFATFRKLDKKLSKASQTAVSVGASLDGTEHRRGAIVRGKSLVQHFVALVNAAAGGAGASAGAGAGAGASAGVDPIFYTRDSEKMHDASALIQTLQAIVEELQSNTTTSNNTTSTPAATSGKGGKGSGGEHVDADGGAPTLMSDGNPEAAAAPAADPFAGAAALIAQLATSLELTVRDRFADALRAGNIPQARRCANTLIGFASNGGSGGGGAGSGNNGGTGASAGAFQRWVHECAAPLDPHVAAASAAAAAASGSAASQFKSFVANLRRLTAAATGILEDNVPIARQVFPPSVCSGVLQRLLTATMSRVQMYVDSHTTSTGASTGASDERLLKYLGAAHIAVYEYVCDAVRIVRGIPTTIAPADAPTAPAGKAGKGAGKTPAKAKKAAAAAAAAAAASPPAPGKDDDDEQDSKPAATSAPISAELAAECMELASTAFASHSHTWLSKELGLIEAVAADIVESVNASRLAACPEEKDIFGRLRRPPMPPDLHRVWLLEQLQTEFADRVLRQAALAVRRAPGLSPPGDCAISIEQVVKDVSVFLCERLMLPLVKEAITLLPNPDGKKPPDHTFFAVSRQCGQLLLRLHRFTARVVLPRLRGDPNAKSVVEARLRSSRRELEGALLSGLEGVMASTTAHMRRILQGQKSGYYRPKDESALMDTASCPAVTALCDVLLLTHGSASYALQGANLDRFLYVLGVHTHALLVDHLRRNSGGVSTLGASLLLRDIAALSDMFSANFCLPKLDMLWADLRKLCLLFFVQPTALRALVTDGSEGAEGTGAGAAGLGKISPALVLEFARMRVDFAANRAVILSQLNVTTGTSASTTAAAAAAVNAAGAPPATASAGSGGV